MAADKAPQPRGRARQAPGRATQSPGHDDALNDRIHELLRDAAATLAERSRTQSAADTRAAESQLVEILSLTRGRDRLARG